MARLLPIDLDLALVGYLTLPTRCPRHIPGIDRLAEDTTRAGASLWWADLAAPRAGLARREPPFILLADWLCGLDPTTIKRVWTEELAHLAVGMSEDRAHEWQWQHYRNVLLPAWAT